MGRILDTGRLPREGGGHHGVDGEEDEPGGVPSVGPGAPKRVDARGDEASVHLAAAQAAQALARGALGHGNVVAQLAQRNEAREVFRW